MEVLHGYMFKEQKVGVCGQSFRLVSRISMIDRS